MPYIVARGQVDTGEHIYEAGEALPDEFADEAMVEAGSIVWTREEPKAPSPYAGLSNKELKHLCAKRELELPGGYLNKDSLIAILALADEAEGG